MNDEFMRRLDGNEKRWNEGKRVGSWVCEFADRGLAPEESLLGSILAGSSVMWKVVPEDVRKHLVSTKTPVFVNAIAASIDLYQGHNPFPDTAFVAMAVYENKVLTAAVMMMGRAIMDADGSEPLLCKSIFESIKAIEKKIA